MVPHLAITVHLHDTRYHGLGEWPPAPARLFQALVAAVAKGKTLPTAPSAALEWLERLSPPIIAAPKQRIGSAVDVFVPNNDLDAEACDPARVHNIRTKKVVRPRLLDGQPAFLYAWPLRSGEAHSADVILAVSEALYQFGRGVDMAWANGEILGARVLWDRLTEGGFDVFLPSQVAGGATLACPAEGTLASLRARHEAFLQRLRGEGTGRAAHTVFVQPPKAAFRQVSYETGCSRIVYELRDNLNDAMLWRWPLGLAGMLVERIRDAAAARLRAALPEASELIDRCFLGRAPNGVDARAANERVRIVPLPSIGHEHADRAIRRILVEVPASSPLPASDVHWSFSGVEVINPRTGEVGPFVLTESSDPSMLDHYSPSSGACRWRSVSAVALPEHVARRRIDPRRKNEQAKNGEERVCEQERAIDELGNALRHAGVFARVLSTRVQREPFESRGSQAEQFAEGTRFNKHRLWHIDVTFDRPVKGPLVIGDGRFLGLGVLAPVAETLGVFGFQVRDGLRSADPGEIARALRRAVMARVQAVLERRAELPTYFSGHESDGSPARHEGHLSYTYDPVGKLLFVIAPHAVSKREMTNWESRQLDTLGIALAGFSELRAGACGLLSIQMIPGVDAEGHLLTSSTLWVTATPYRVTRHLKAGSAKEAIALDVEAECRRAQLPNPKSVQVGDVIACAGSAISGSVRLEFSTAVRGPILLGRTRYLGGGLFLPVRIPRSQNAVQSRIMSSV